MLFRLIFTSVFFSMFLIVSNPLLAMDAKASKAIKEESKVTDPLPGAPGGPTAEKVKATLGDESVCGDQKVVACGDEQAAIVQPRAYIWRAEPRNVIGELDLGSPLNPRPSLTITILFDQEVPGEFLGNFFAFITQKQFRKNYFTLRRGKLGAFSRMHFETFLSQAEFQAFLDEVNNHFNNQ
jgi:hypothetical protein